MQYEGIFPDIISLICILTACASMQAADKCEQIHGMIARHLSFRENVVLGTALVDMHAKCGALTKAQQVLEELLVRDVVSWSALITGYVQQGQTDEALNCFDRMQEEGLSPNPFTFSCILKACGSMQALERGKEIHVEILRLGLLEKNNILANALVDMYMKCGAFVEAHGVLAGTSFHDVISWSVLIAGYVDQGHPDDALSCFEQMQYEGLRPTVVTFSSILKSCASIGAAEKGKRIHNEIVQLGLLGKHAILDTALVDMYVKCGAFEKAQAVFNELPVRDVVSWTVLVSGYAQNGCSMEALECLEQMLCEGLIPVMRTFTSVLSACSHSGLVNEGQVKIVQSSAMYGIRPEVEYHGCLVDILARAGEFDKALIVIQKMPSCDYIDVWHALLSACFKWGNVKLGRLAFEHAIQVDRGDAAAYLSMAKIYVAAGMQEDADIIELMRVENKAW